MMMSERQYNSFMGESMTEIAAIKEMVRAHGEETMYSDGAYNWDSDELIHAVSESYDIGEGDGKEYLYSSGKHGTRPGVYEIIDGYLGTVPQYEPMSRSKS